MMFITIIFFSIILYVFVKQLSGIANEVTSCFPQEEPEIEEVIEEIEETKKFRPQNFDEYIGQEQAKELLTAYINQVDKRDMQMPHMLIYGSAGFGKTTLAYIMKNMLCCPLTEVLASNIKDADQLYNLVKNSGLGILFIDEVHGLSRDIAEKLYSLMEDFKIEGNAVLPFTLIGATTECGEVITKMTPFYDRFEIKLELQDYTLLELNSLIYLYLKKEFPDDTLNDDVINLIAENCRKTPRKAISLLKNTIFLGDIEKTLSLNQIIYRGYTKKDLKVLSYIDESQSGASANRIATFLGTNVKNYSYEIEPYLIKSGIITVTRKGRILTESGKKILRILKEKENKL